MPSRSSSPEMNLQLGESFDHPRSGTKRDRSSSLELLRAELLRAGSADATPSKKARYTKKESQKDSHSDTQKSDHSGATSDNGKFIDDSQPDIELHYTQEQGITTEDKELGGNTRDNDVRDGDVNYAGRISNPAGLPYSVTGRLIAGSSVTLEFAKDQYLHVAVYKDPKGGNQDSGQAVKLALFVADEARKRELSDTLFTQLDRHASERARGNDNVDKGSQPRAQDVSEVSEKRSPSQERQPTQADTKVKEGTGALRKNDQMDLDSETN